MESSSTSSILTWLSIFRFPSVLTTRTLNREEKFQKQRKKVLWVSKNLKNKTEELKNSFAEF